MVARRKAVIIKNGEYKKVDQIRPGGKWIPRHAMASGGSPAIAAAASRVRAFRHIWHPKGDRRLHVFKFRIERDDLTILDHKQVLDIDGIVIYQSRKDHPEVHDVVGRAHGYVEGSEDAAYWDPPDPDDDEKNTWYYSRGTSEDYMVEFSYNEKTQIWTVPFLEWPNMKVRKGKIFWVTFYCEYSVRSMYKVCPIDMECEDHPEYHYKPDDFYAEDDTLRPKFYEVRVPYFKADLSGVRTPPSEECSGEFPFCCVNAARCYEGTYGSKIYTVGSSIHYTIEYVANGIPYGAYKGRWNVICEHLTMEECYLYAFINSWVFHIWDIDTHEWTDGIDIDLSVICSNGAASSDIDSNPIDSVEEITPEPYIVQTLLHNIAAETSGVDHVIYTPCNDGIQEFNVPFRVMKIRIGIDVEPNLE